MGVSIQDYLKKINSKITLLDCLSLLVTMLFLVGFWIFIYKQKEINSLPVSYIENKSANNSNTGVDYRPFASINGKTYTFSWCQRSNVISVKNRVYFNSETEARNSGRTLSKLCQK